MKKVDPWKKLNELRFYDTHKKVFHPHLMWTAFCITKPKVGFVKFDFDVWGEESFVCKGFCRYETEIKDEYVETEKYKLIWIPCGFRFFMWVAKMRLSWQTTQRIKRIIHPFKYGFWCQMCIVTADYAKHPYLGMLWETWDSYAGDGDGGWDYRWTGNRKTWKELKWYKKFGIDDEGFVFILPFFIAWLLVLPGTLYNIYKLNEEMKYYNEHYNDYFEESDMEENK